MKIREYTFDDAEAHAEVHRESVRGIASDDFILVGHDITGPEIGRLDRVTVERD